MTNKLNLVLTAAAFTAAAAATPALAADNAMKVCGAKYQAAKTAKTLPSGETWGQFLAQCRSTMAKPAVVVTPAKPIVAATAKPAPARVVTAKPVVAPVAKPAPARVVTAKPATTPGQPSAAQAAMYARERQCGAQWRADKAANKVPAGETWPQYWSACNKRLK